MTLFDSSHTRTRKPAIANGSPVRWCTRSTWPWTTLKCFECNETLDGIGQTQTDHFKIVKYKMVNGSRYRALESVSIASALSSALTIYPCQIRVHQTLTVLNSNFLQLGRRSGGRPRQTVYPRRLPVNCDTHYVSRHRTHNLPIVSPTRY